MVKLATRIKHVHVFEKSGKTYVYYRKGKTQVRIRRDLDDVAGIRAEVDKIERALAAKQVPQEPAFEPGTLGAVLAAYQASDWWTTLKPATQTSYERAFAALQPLMRRRAASLTRPMILELRDRGWLPAHGRWMANNTVTVLGILLKFAKDKGVIATDPLAERVRKIRRRKGGAQPNRPWSEAERRIVLEEAPPHVRLVLALAMCTGLRKADLFAVTFGDVRDGDIAVVTSKRDEPVSIPVHPVLAEALAQAGARVGKIATTAAGKPYTPDGFDTVWHRLRTRLEAEGKVAKGLTLHGLRHTLGTMLKEAGMADGDIADVLGQATVSMARHYSKNAGLSAETRAKIVGLRISGEKG